MRVNYRAWHYDCMKIIRAIRDSLASCENVAQNLAVLSVAVASRDTGCIKHLPRLLSVITIL